MSRPKNDKISTPHKKQSEVHLHSEVGFQAHQIKPQVKLPHRNMQRGRKA